MGLLSWFCKACPKCGYPLSRTKAGKVTTYYCSKCGHIHVVTENPFGAPEKEKKQ